MDITLPSGDITVTIDLYSGRPNPWWVLSSREADECRRRLAALPEGQRSPVAEPGMGYRGCVLQAGGREVRLYGGGASAGGGFRDDPARAFESWVLATGEAHGHAAAVDAARACM